MIVPIVVVGVRVKREINEELEKADRNTSEIIRSYFKEPAWSIRVKKTIEKLDKLLEETKPGQSGFASRSVREDRDSRWLLYPSEVHLA